MTCHALTFTRQNYPHECMQPVRKFQNYFRRVGE
ncbi:DUF4222 domain-containing protein [Salmonella enterica]|nr:DUF4222 domain-containing protein [Salmonella enterica]